MKISCNKLMLVCSLPGNVKDLPIHSQNLGCGQNIKLPIAKVLLQIVANIGEKLNTKWTKNQYKLRTWAQ